MRCEEFRALLPSFPDDLREAKTAQDLKAHAAECEACATLLAEHETMLQALNALDEGLVVPETFSEGWRKAIAEETAREKPSRNWNLHRWALAGAALVMLISSTALMRAGLLFPSMRPDQQAGYLMPTGEPVPPANMAAVYSAPDSEAAEMARAYSAPDAGAAETAGAGAADMAPDAMEGAFFLEETEPAQKVPEAMMLYGAALHITTEQYDQAVSRIEALLLEAEGWSERTAYTGTKPEESVSGRTALMTLRVPLRSLDAFFAEASSVGTVLSSERTAEDIAESFYDVRGRLANCEAQRDRLLELMGQAGSVAEIMEVETRLDEIQRQIESLAGQLNTWNSRGDNAVVTISVTEIFTAGQNGASLWARMVEALESSYRSLHGFLADMLVFLVMIAPYLLAALALAGTVLAAVWALRKRKYNQRRNEKP